MRRLLFATAILLLGLNVLGPTLSLRAMSELSQEITFLNSTAVPSVAAANRLSAAWSELRAIANTMLLARTDQEKAEASAQLTSNDVLWMQSYALYGGTASQSSAMTNHHITSLADDRDAYVASARQMSELADTGQFEVARLLFTGKMEDIYQGGAQRIFALVENDLTTVRTRALAAEATRASAVQHIFWMEFALCAALVAFILLTRSMVVRPLVHLASATADLATGRQAARVPFLNWRNEIGALARALENFRETSTNRDDLAGRLAQDAKLRETRQRLIDEAIETFRDGIGRSVDHVTSSASTFSHAASTVHSTLSTSSMEARDAAEASGVASDGVNAVAAAVEQLTTSIGEINDRVSTSRN